MQFLTSIWRTTIQNQETEGLIAKIRDQYESLNRIDVYPTDKLFFVILGTDHRRGPARMLTTYPKMFGYKTIVAVSVLPTPPSLWSFQSKPNLLPSPLRLKTVRSPRKKGERRPGMIRN
jgi:hypothetical protein